MPITRSAKKALRQNLKRRIKNTRVKVKMRDLLKKVRLFVAQKNSDQARALLPQVYKTLDKAAKKGLIKKQNAWRKKSRIALLIQRTRAS